MAIGDDGRPHGVSKGGIRARGVKGGWGREERPVPPMIAMGTGSVALLLVIECHIENERGFACICGG